MRRRHHRHLRAIRQVPNLVNLDLHVSGFRPTNLARNY